MSTSSATRSGNTASLDPDVLAALEREQSFLLRSLDDLDAEFQAGDLDEHDHNNLTDDYTRRLAEVTRSIDEQRTAFEAVDTRLSAKQRWLTIGVVVVLAVIAGMLLARASGFRSPTGALSGDIRQSSSGLLSEADTLTREGRLPEAIEIYTEVLDVAPGNVEALTYRGWLTARTGDEAAGLVDLTEAVAVDPDYPDARVFSAILLDNSQRFDDAAEQLTAFDALDPPDVMQQLVTNFSLRESVAAGQIKQRFEPGQQVDLSEIAATPDTVARAGALLSQLGDVVLAQATFDAVLGEDPDQVIALVGKGQLARDAGLFELSPEIAMDALASLDRAVELAPNEPAVRLYRADARAAQGDPDGARSDLAEVDPATLSPDLSALYEVLTAELG